VNIHNHERTLALAGVMQAAGLVNQIARGRWIDQQIITSSVESLFVFTPKNVLNVFGDDINNLQFGLRRLTTFFPKPDRQHDGEVANYLFGTILLSRMVEQDKERMQKISHELELLAQGRPTGNIDEEQLYAKLAQIYMENVSTLKRRIHVVGSRDILQQTREINSIRALLLAALRSAILWHQVGGRIWHLWWKRQKIVDLAHELLVGH
jgi:high frequency lysogenization protein